MKSYSDKIADFVFDLKFEDIPKEVVEDVKFRFLDIIGICLACSNMEYAKIIINYVTDMGGKGESTIIGTNQRAPSALAALVNGSLAHGADFDDTHGESIVHPSSVIVPTSIAISEKINATGKDAIAAAVAGYEVCIRVGMVAPAKFHERGYHPTPICGAFGGAITAGKLLSLNKTQLINALGIVGSQAAGLLEFLTSGAWVKRLHPGWASHSGIIASSLASKGFTGPPTIFEGRFGLYNSHLHGDDYNLSKLVEGLGVNWETPKTVFKPYPCGHLIHPFLDCAHFLQKKYKFSAQDIAEITCYVPPQAIPIVCEPIDVKIKPPTPYAAQFSTQFSLAVLITEGRVGIDEYSEEKIRDPKILSLAERVVCLPHKYENFPRYFPGRVKIVLKNGNSFEHQIESSRGSREYPMGKEDHIEKFMSNAERVLTGASIEKIISNVMKLETLGTIEPIMNLLIPS